MRGFFDRLRWRLSDFMMGRYGFDKLSRDVLIIGLVFWVLACFVSHNVFVVLYDLCLLWVLFRALSRNIYKRQRELTAYLRWREKPARHFALQKRKWADRKTHKYFKCSCGKILRVPKGKGKIKMHCANCGRDMIKKT